MYNIVINLVWLLRSVL